MIKDINRIDIKEKVRKDYEWMNLHMKWYNVDDFITQVEYIYIQISESHLKQLVENP